MSDLIVKLDELAGLRSAQDAINLEKQAIIDTILTPEIKAKIAEIEAEFAGKGEVATAKATELEIEIKKLVIERAPSVKKEEKTVHGTFLMAVYSPPKISWDSKGLDGFSITHPEILYMRKEGDPSVSIRRI